MLLQDPIGTGTSLPGSLAGTGTSLPGCPVTGGCGCVPVAPETGEAGTTMAGVAGTIRS